MSTGGQGTNCRIEILPKLQSPE